MLASQEKFEVRHPTKIIPESENSNNHFQNSPFKQKSGFSGVSTMQKHPFLIDLNSKERYGI